MVPIRYPYKMVDAPLKMMVSIRCPSKNDGAYTVPLKKVGAPLKMMVPIRFSSNNDGAYTVPV